MIRVFIINIILLFSLGTNCSLQDSDCKDAAFYELSLNHLSSKSNRKIEVSFNYSMSESLKESVFKSSLFTEEEVPLIEQGLMLTGSSCDKFDETIEELGDRPLSDKLRYTVVRYSKPIFVLDDKVYLFLEVLTLQEDYSIPRGGINAVQIFKKDDGVWILEDQKTLESY